MTPERWEQIKQLYNSARELEPQQREAFLQNACAGDELLRQEIDRLLAQQAEAEDLLGVPAFEVAVKALAHDTKVAPRADHVGRTLLHYRITEEIGEGGMGVVYKARDLHLDRAVAVKVLPADAMSDPERKRRFVQEARAASALNHPGIVQIYDINSDIGVDFIAMEYVAGETLDRRFGRKGLPIGVALRYAVQIADALAAAHRAGIVHRDLKPANLMVTESGLTKVLDFGLAKLMRTPRSDASGTEPSDLVTEDGRVMGTVAYMSPEQAEGRSVDARSDIFSFGSVLYEMITGCRPFQGETKLAILSAVSSQEPRSIREIAGGVPPELERIVVRCLRKDPDRRFQHMEDLKVALQELKEESDSGRLAGPPSASRKGERRALAAGIAAGVLLAGAAAVTAWWLGPAGPRVSAPALTPLTSDSGLSYMPALSPDGRLLAYASDRSGDGNFDIWVKQVAGGEPARLTRHTAADLEPAFSPDGTRIAFRSEREGRGIYVISALGGDERRVVEQGYQPQWSPDGQWISYGVNTTFSNLIYAVPYTGGTPRQLAPEMATARPSLWSADGKHILFWGSKDRKVWDWWVAPFDGGPAVRTGALAMINRHKLKHRLLYPFGLGSAGWPSAWSAEADQVLFSAVLEDSANIWALSISPRTWEVTGAPQQLTSGSGTELGPSVSAGGPSGQRLLAFANLASNSDVWSQPVDHKQGTAAGELERLTRDAAEEISPFPSADGQRMVFVVRRSGIDAMWMKDLATGRATPIPTAGINPRPVLARDGSKMAYSSFPTLDIRVIAIGSGGHLGEARQVCKGCGMPTDWSADGSQVLYAADPGQRGGVALLDVATGKSVELLESEHTLRKPRFSPDDNWILFVESFATGGGRMWIAPLKHPARVPQSEWILISEGPGFQEQACWGPDGNLIYLVSERDAFRCIWGLRLESSTKRPRGAPFPVRHFHAALSMTPFADYLDIGLNAAGDRLFFSLVESIGNIWLARIGAR